MESWRKRLIEAVDADPRSDRAISIAAGIGVNAVNELRNTGKKPSVERALMIANEVGISLSRLFLDLDISVEEEEMIRLMSAADPDVQEAVLTILRGKKPKEG